MRLTHAVGMTLAASAAILWIIASLVGGPDVWALFGLAAILIGFLIVAWGAYAIRTPALVTGFLTVAVGMVIFYRGDLWSGIYNTAGLIFAVGAILGALGAWRDTVLVQRSGLLVATIGSLVWVYADLGAWWWQPGNVLMAIGCATAAWGVRK